MTNPLKSRSGMLLYRHLPEEYRYRDNPSEDELGDLEAYLHGFGDLIDRFRDTLDQAYADGFAEETDTGDVSQSWVLPYLASLFGAQLVSPDLDGTARIRRKELNRTVQWSKGKGTLDIADDVADILADAETVMVEGWKRTATTPRLALPPFRLPPEATQKDMYPLGTPDMRLSMRAVADLTQSLEIDSFGLSERGADGLAQKTVAGWRILNRRGVPCFPNAYDDRTVRTPDLRTNAQSPSQLGPAPRRVTVHAQPPAGFFELGLLSIALTDSQLSAAQDLAEPPHFVVGPKEILAVVSPDRTEPIPDRINISTPLSVKAGEKRRLQRVNLLGPVTVKQDAFLSLDQVAVQTVTVEKAEEAPALIATNCLFEEIKGPAGFVRLEYCTVISKTQTAVLQASDCIFVGAFDDPGCFGSASCVRFSRLPSGIDQEACVFARARHNTEAKPVFVQRIFATDVTCEIRSARFGEPGCGVLDTNTPPLIADGAEGGMEMGAYHHMGYAARLAATIRKLEDQLPLGQELDLRHDPMMTRLPPELNTG